MERTVIKTGIVAITASVSLAIYGNLIVGGPASEILWSIIAAVSFVYSIPAALLGLHVLHKANLNTVPCVSLGIIGGGSLGSLAFTILNLWLFLDGSFLAFLGAGATGGGLAGSLEWQATKKIQQTASPAAE
jgi:hypothetical protein